MEYVTLCGRKLGKECELGEVGSDLSWIGVYRGIRDQFLSKSTSSHP